VDTKQLPIEVFSAKLWRSSQRNYSCSGPEALRTLTNGQPSNLKVASRSKFGGTLHRSSLNLCLLSLSVLFLQTPASSTGFPSLPELRTVGGVPVVGDFNGDGKLDLLHLLQCQSPLCTSLKVTVDFGLGGGQLSSRISSTIPVSATLPLFGSPLLAADFNGDHKLDIGFGITSPSNTALFVVALGKGDGTFAAPVTYSVGGYIHALVGDVNGDHKPDIVLPFSSPSGPQLNVLLNNGDGTFKITTAPGSFGCLLADLNGDGNVDLLGSSLQIANGDGTFQPPVPIPGTLGFCPAVADFNGDGKLDIAVASTVHGISLLLGNGNGTFQPPNFQPVVDRATDLFVGDFNGDGKPDLITKTNSSSLSSVILNIGNGKFKKALSYQFPGSLSLDINVLADFNGDGRTDFLCQHLFFDSNVVSVSLALAAPDGTFPVPRGFWIGVAPFARSIATGDLNGDGSLDLVVAGTTNNVQGTINRLLGHGDGTFGITLSFATGLNKGAAVSLLDVNHDAKADAVVVGNSLTVRLGSGTGSFAAPITLAHHGGTEFAAADFDGDGNIDLASLTGEVLLGNGDGTFRVGTPFAPAVDFVVSGDFNSDGKQDLAIASAGQVGILLGNGNGTFQPAKVFRTGQTGTLVVADFNRDGKLDVAAAGAFPQSASVSVYLGDGAGGLNLPINRSISHAIFTQNASFPLVSADFNRDGIPDLAAAFNGFIVILQGSGDGTFLAPRPHTMSFDLSGLTVGDFNRDGRPDLAAVVAGSGVAILVNEP